MSDKIDEVSNNTSPPLTKEEKQKKELEFINNISRMTYARLSKEIVQDLINNRKESVIFKKFTKEEIITALSEPQASEKKLRLMSRFLWENSSQYRRLGKYYSRLPTFDYTVTCYNTPTKYNPNSFLVNYYKVINLIEKMNLKHELLKIFDICWREDIFAGLYFETNDSFTIIPINNDYIKISSVVDGCLVYSLDFSYFNDKLYLLDSYGNDIKEMYYNYAGYQEIAEDGKKGKKIKGDSNLRWQEPLNQICLKVNEDQLLYSNPPFSAIFPDILNLEDYKLLKKAGEELKNYKVLAMKLPLDDEGNLAIDEPMAEKYYTQACNNIAAGVGLIMSPMEIEQFDFQNSATSETDEVLASEQELFSSAGSSINLFGGGDKPSSSSLQLSTKNDEVLAFSLLKQVARWINKYIKNLNLPYDFKIKFLDTSIYNKTDVFNTLLKAGQAGVPCKMEIAASLGLSPSDIIGNALIENDILKLRDTLFSQPLLSSSTMSPDNEGGAPTNKDKGESITDSTEAGQENNANEEN